MPFIVANIKSTYMLIANTGKGNIPGRLWDMAHTFMDVIKVCEAEYNETWNTKLSITKMILQSLIFVTLCEWN